MSDWEFNFEGDDPSSHFDLLKEAIETYQKEFSDEPENMFILGKALEQIDQAIAELEAQQPSEPDHEHSGYRGSATSGPAADGGRSIFDDVDQ